MYFFTALLTFLRVQSALTEKVPGDRIYIGEAKQTASLPYIVITEISNVGSHNRDCPDGIARPHMQIVSYASSYGVAHQVAKILKTILDGYKGVMSEISGVECRYNDESDDTYPELSPMIFSVVQDYYFSYKE